ncbi:c-type cytochrome biogenesis protein CcmI [Algicella marina]|uniref:c-type cytochrome biogenesis protein CcmI n=1 Tax=Algicella marina TaxID=2683284 RepID=UPI0024DFDD14|nr:c-type cytochrome biogenesis protein CcmI [Algicella marina]
MVLRQVWNAPATASDGPGKDLGVYRDQLNEIERDLARGTLSSTEAENLRVEISRRILAGHGNVAVAADTSQHSFLAVGLAVVFLFTGLATYLLLGASGLPDQPLQKRLAEESARVADRVGQKEAEAMISQGGPELDPEELALIDRLENLLKDRPDDVRGYRLLAGNLANLRLFSRAARAQAHLVDLLGEMATADDIFALAEYRILAVKGYVSPEAERALRRTLTLAPSDPRARYYSGLLAYQSGRADIAYDLWNRLLAEGPSNAPWIAAIRSQIAEVAIAAGRNVPTGPSGADIAASEAMSDDERAAMIEGMVEGLALRLADEGGTLDEWERLIRAYGVLGRTADASRAWQDARQIFTDDEVALNRLQQAARDAEVAQ